MLKRRTIGHWEGRPVLAALPPEERLREVLPEIRRLCRAARAAHRRLGRDEAADALKVPLLLLSLACGRAEAALAAHLTGAGDDRPR